MLLDRGARGRVDTGLVLWLCRRLGTRTMERLSGGRGQTGARWQWSLETSEWPGSPAVREETTRRGERAGQADWGLRKMLLLFRDEQRSRVGHAYARAGLCLVQPRPVDDWRRIGPWRARGGPRPAGTPGAEQQQQQQQSLGVAWRDVRAMQVRSDLGGRAAWDLGAAVVDR